MVSAGCKSARGCDPADVTTQAAWFNESFAMLRTNFQGYCEGDDLPPTAAIQGESLHGVIEVDVSAPDQNLAGVHDRWLSSSSCRNLNLNPLRMTAFPRPVRGRLITQARLRRVCVVVCLAVRCDV